MYLIGDSTTVATLAETGRLHSCFSTPLIVRQIEEEWHQLKTHEIAGRMLRM